MSWSGEEKRNFIRANFPCKIIIHTPKEHIINSHTENIGAGGVRVIIEENLNISSFVGLDVLLGSMQIICKGRIVWVVEKPDSSNNEFRFWDTGIEFYEIEEKERTKITEFIHTITSKNDFRKS